MSKCLWLSGSLVGLLFVVALAQENTLPAPAASTPATMPASSPATSMPATQSLAPFHDLKIDLAKRQIIMQARVCLTQGPLELLVCKAQSKEYESILQTPATPSHLHAALLALGLTPGKPARAAISPDREKLVPLPPQGAALSIRLRWKDANNLSHEVNAGEWLERPGQQEDLKLASQWIFVGSDISPRGTYAADDDGDVISVANFAASVIDVPFESSNKNDVLVYHARKGAIPPVGTPVEVIIQALPGAEHAPHARVNMEIDRFGRCSVDGREIPSDQLMAWGQQYIADHTKGEVVLRVDGRALAYDIQHAQQELRIGGVYDTSPVILAPSSPILPRSEPQARESLKHWNKRFEHPREFIREPSQEAQELLAEIQTQQEQLTSLHALYGEYSQHLNAAFKKYKATSQAATAESPAPE